MIPTPKGNMPPFVGSTFETILLPMTKQLTNSALLIRTLGILFLIFVAVGCATPSVNKWAQTAPAISPDSPISSQISLSAVKDP